MTPAFVFGAFTGSALPRFRPRRAVHSHICMGPSVKGSSENPYRVAVLEGDGAGPRVADATIKVLEGLQESAEVYFDFTKAPYGAPAFENEGILVPSETISICQGADAVLRSYQGTARGEGREGSAHFQLRDGLGLFAQIRPVVVYPQLIAASPLRPEVVEGVDLMLVREISAGALGTQALADEEETRTIVSYTREEVSRIADIAWDLAERRGGRLLNVDKADAMRVSRFWRACLAESFERRKKENSGIFWEDMYVDDFMRELILRPANFDVIVTSNLFGDVLAEAMDALAGSQRVSPSIWVNEAGLGVYGPADIYNPAAYPGEDDEASPLALIRSASMMLRYAFDEPAAADLIQQALRRTMEDLATPGTSKVDGNGATLPTVGTAEYADTVIRSLDLMRQYEAVCNPVECGE